MRKPIRTIIAIPCFAIAMLCLVGAMRPSQGSSQQSSQLEQPSQLETLGIQPKAPSYTHFESGPVRPIALSPDGKQLFATNISDAHLEIYWVKAGGTGLEHRASVPVGLEPVAVAAESNNRVWVINHLSDSVSIIDLGLAAAEDQEPQTPRVVKTLLLGDEPRDIVFAGPNNQRAFITTARRGQNSVVDLGLEETTSGRANVWVYDTTHVAKEPVPAPLEVLTLFGDTPRALAASPDGKTVYASVFKSGNRTTSLTEIIDELLVLFKKERRLGPTTNHAGDLAPHVSRILQEDAKTGAWLDVAGNDFNEQIPFTLPDQDVFAIDAMAKKPKQVASYSGIGAILFNMATHPVTGELFVTNTFANNMVRFEGPGDYLRSMDPDLKRSQATVQGKLHLYRMSVLDPKTGVAQARHLNKHINYDLDPIETAKSKVRDHSLATPLDMAFTDDGSTLYVAAFGSNKIGVFDSKALADDSFAPNSKHHIELSGGGPAGLALDEPNNRLYVYTRFNNAVAIVDTQSKEGAQSQEIGSVLLPNNPEPEVVREGRRFLYDARFTSSNGEASCSSCHIFSDGDGLAWDLGNPDDVVSYNNVVQRDVPLDQLENEFKLFFRAGKPIRSTFTREFHPMKGPMMTQNLRGMNGQGPLHWRGDRRGGAMSMQREDPESLDSLTAFKEFNVAFEGLLGRAQGPLSDPQIDALAKFHLQIPYPPNPIRALDNSLTPQEDNGREVFVHALTSAPRANSGAEPTLTCNSCHVLNPADGKFGSGGVQAFDALNQMFKVPHLRDLYQKIGMSGQQTLESAGDTGPAVRGYGLNSDGFVSSAYSFVGGRVAPEPDDERTFRFPGDTPEERRQNRRDVERFLYAFDTDTLPAMGQQVTLTATNGELPVVAGRAETVLQRINLLRARALHPIRQGHPRDARPDCELVAKGVIGGEQRGYVLRSDGNYLTDQDQCVSQEALLEFTKTPGQELTFTCVPVGAGFRMGVDRNGDGVIGG